MESSGVIQPSWYSPRLFDGVCWTPDEPSPHRWAWKETEWFEGGFRTYLEEARTKTEPDAPNWKLFNVMNALRVFANNKGRAEIAVTKARFLLIPEVDPNNVQAALDIMVRLHRDNAYELMTQEHVDAVASIPSRSAPGRYTSLVDDARTIALRDLAQAPKVAMLMRGNEVKTLDELRTRLSVMADVPLSIADGAL